MRRKSLLLGLMAALIVLAGLYGALVASVAGQVPSNVRVDGISIGGMQPGEATNTLRRALAARTPQTVQLSAGARSVDLEPGAAGLGMDVESTVAALTRYTVNPTRLWSHLTGTENRPFKLRVDRGKLEAAVAKAARSLDRPVGQGSVTFADGKANEVLSVPGRKVNVAETADAVATAWPRQLVVRAVSTTIPPKVPAAEIKRITQQFARPAMSAPLTVRTGGVSTALQPRQYSSALAVVPAGAGKLQPRIDTKRLMALVRAAAPGIEAPPVDATVRLVAGRPRIVPAVVGTRFDDQAAAARFRSALTSPSRTVAVTLVRVQPKVTTAAAVGWRITAPISTFTTIFPVNPPRTNNIKIAVAALNGTLVRPGEQFSLNATLGQRTPAKGYAKAPVILDGRLVSDYGGGVSQVSTTVFNAAFFAGVRLDQHTPHSFYIPRYPEGREATVSWPDVDQKWTANAGSGVLVQAGVKGANLTVTLWGTKALEVTAVKGARRNLVNPRSIVDARPGCVPQAPTPGFDVTVAQIFKRNGAQVKSVRFDTHYIPEDKVTCTSPAATR